MGNLTFLSCILCTVSISSSSSYKASNKIALAAKTPNKCCSILSLGRILSLVYKQICCHSNRQTRSCIVHPDTPRLHTVRKLRSRGRNTPQPSLTFTHLPPTLPGAESRNPDNRQAKFVWPSGLSGSLDAVGITQRPCAFRLPELSCYQTHLQLCSDKYVHESLTTFEH